MKKFFKNLFLPVLGLSSLVWFLIRVIPKPSRAQYPCMKAAAPLASAFVVWVMGLFGSVLLFKKSRQFMVQSRKVLAGVALSAAVVLALVSQLSKPAEIRANLTSTLEGPNLPMGTGTGIHPGRVAWIHNTAATDETCKNSSGDYWYQDDNTNQAVVDQMLSDGLKRLTGEASDAAAWNALFRYYNQQHGKGDVGYTAGEKFAIKINLNGLNNGTRKDANINTSPQVCLALLRQLVDVVGVAQADIHIGDTNVGMNSALYNKLHAAYPNVKYWGSGPGMTAVTASSSPVLFASDGSFEDKVPKAYQDAAYLINVPVLKKHHRAGISIACKNHFGSLGAFTGGAWHLHPSLPATEGGGEVNNGEYGVYRSFVDFMGHKDLGLKTLLILVDGLWSSVNWGHPAVKWEMTPFNNDWPNSLFLSQDQVAVESVCFDFLYKEFDEDHPTEGAPATDSKGPFPHFAGTDDYLHQAADSQNWPSGLTYDPDNDGVPMPASMGTHEHWNNDVDKKYSRNLGLNKGIELSTNVTNPVLERPEGSVVPAGFSLEPNYPNPFNASTTIQYRLDALSRVRLTVYDAAGRRVRTLFDGTDVPGERSRQWNGLDDNGSPVPTGVYICRITARAEGRSFSAERKMVMAK
ncbi:MAG: DUF362 domain-containing protein [bacterium]|nr:DUF362 domain-containing protein [bacterium]